MLVLSLAQVVSAYASHDRRCIVVYTSTIQQSIRSLNCACDRQGGMMSSAVCPNPAQAFKGQDPLLTLVSVSNSLHAFLPAKIEGP